MSEMVGSSEDKTTARAATEKTISAGSALIGTRHLLEPLVYEMSSPGRVGVNLPESEVPFVAAEAVFGESLTRAESVKLPELSELDVVRHYTRLSRLNFSVDEFVYPLGSCTMKYNPRVNEDAARLPGFSRLHPHTPEKGIQGALAMMYDLGQKLKLLTGMDDVTLVPGAGAHGELAGVLMIRQAHKFHGLSRDVMLIPDTAHGTNPATCTLAGLTTKQIATGKRGVIEPEVVASLLDDRVAGIMLTNPNTLGLFEEHVEEIASLVHRAGGYVYMDGANLNALIGKARPGDFGIDALHINLHKTFAQPHGGGGPGAGPVVVSSALKPFLPYPRITKEGGVGTQPYYRLHTSGYEQSIGFLREFYGNFGVFVRAYAYILRLGSQGACAMSEHAVLNANYVRSMLKEDFHLAFETPSMHECVFDESTLSSCGVSTLELAKRLLDYGFHPPTVYFPLVVKGALMIEPTESESKQSLDRLCAALKAIAQEARTNPELLRKAPHTTPVGRLDETAAARSPRLRYLWPDGKATGNS